MRKLWTILFVLAVLLPITVMAGGTIQLKASGMFIATHDVPDSAGTGYDNADSVNVTVVFQDGTVSLDSVWYNVADAQAVAINDALYFFDAWDDMNGSDGVGTYVVHLMWYDGTDAALEYQETYTVIQTTMSLEDMGDTTLAILAVLDSMRYMGWRGPGIFLSRTSGNTGTVMGIDGTENNPVDNFADAKTLADNLGIKRYYFTERSVFEGANDLTVTHEAWEFIGIGAGNSLELDAAGVDVDGSYFESLVLFGTQGGNQPIFAVLCTIGRLIDADGHFHDCGLTDTIFIANSDEIFLDHCHSEIAGNGRPGIGFGQGIVSLNMRDYSGGIEIREMDGNDNATIEGRGQVVVNANCTNAPITVRGFFTLTDNDGGTVWTRDAVFSRQESGGWVGDTVWGKNFSDAIAAAGSMGDSLGTQSYIQGSASGLDSSVVANAVAEELENVGYSNADSTLTLTQLNILAVGNNDAVVITAAPGGTGHGINVTAGTTGDALRLKAGSQSGSGIFAWAPGVAGTGAYGINVQSTDTGFFVVGNDAAIIPNWFGPDTLSTTYLARLLAHVRDSVWKADSAANNGVAGSFGLILAKPAYVQGSASGLDSIAVAGAAQQALEDIGYSSTDSTLHLHQLSLIANSTTDTGLIVMGSDAGPAAFFLGATTGEGIKSVGGNNAHGMHLIGTAGNDGLRSQGGSTAGSGIRAIGGANGGHGMRLAGQGSGHGLRTEAGVTGDGIRAVGGATSGSGLFASGPGSAGSGAYGIKVQASDTGLFVDGADGQIVLDGDFKADSLDMATEAAAGGGSDTVAIKAAAANNPDLFYGPSATGTGTDSVLLYLNDTSGTDTPIGDVFVTVKNSVGSKVIINTTDASTGKLTVHLDAGDYTVEARKTGYLWESYALTVAGDIDSVEVAGYDIELDAPASANLCNVFGWLYDAGDQPIVGAVIRGLLLGGMGVDTTTGDSAKMISTEPVTAITDTLGRFQLYLYRSIDYGDTTRGRYNITGHFNGSELFNVKRLYVPDAIAFDIGDTILSRGSQ